MSDVLQASLMGGAIAGAIVFVLALPALRGPQRWWIPLAVFAAFVDESSIKYAGLSNHDLHLIAGNWNWAGKTAELVAMSAVALVLILTGVFSRGDMGITFRQKPGTLRAVLFVVLPYLIVVEALIWKMSTHDVPDTETLAFQATLPGLTEELYFRGILLAIFDRMFAPSRTILGARLGYGAIATTIAFAAAHTFSVHRNLAIDFELLPAIAPLIGGLFAAWIRERSGSLVVPVVAHNLSNTAGVIVPMLA